MKDMSMRWLILLCVFFTSFTVHAGTFTAYENTQTLKVAYFGKPDILFERLSLDPKIQLVMATPDENLELYNSAVLYNSELEKQTLEKLKTLIKAGELGLVVNLGENISAQFLSDLLETDLSIIHSDSFEKTDSRNDFGEIIEWIGSNNHSLAQSVSWKSSPKVLEFSHIQFHETSQHKVLVSSQNKSENSLAAIPMLIEFTLGKGKIYLLSPWIKKGNDAERLEHFWSVVTIPNKNAYNYTFYNWAYFNWLQNSLIYQTSNLPSSSFSGWPYSPIPQPKHKLVLNISIALVLLSSFLLFFWVRKISLKEENKLTVIRNPDYELKVARRIEKINRARKKRTGFSRVLINLHFKLATLFYSEIAQPKKQWEEVGFIRPLAGFQMIVACIYIGLIPVLIFAAVMLNYIVPFPQSLGMTSWVSGAFSLLFTIFDLGTGIAMIKYFSEYRVKDPVKAMHFVQFYIWFQLLSGIVQVSILTITASRLAPDTAYAFMTWMILFKLLIQFPGFAAVFGNIFMALQRYDLMLLTWVLPIPLSAFFTLIAMFWIRSWGLDNPIYGEIMGLSLGEIAPQFIGSWIYIFVSLLIFKGLGFSLKATFSAHFNFEVVKKSLSFGLRYTPGAIAPLLSSFAIPILLSLSLNNYLELSSMLIAALWINFLIRGPGFMLYSNLLPSISEAYSHNKIILSAHYIDQALKWSLMFVGGVLPYFIILGEDVALAIMPTQWSTLSQYVALAVIFGSIEFLGTLPDETYKAVGKPQIFTYINLSDHILRVVLMIFLIPDYGVYGVLYSLIISATLRCIISWIILARFILPLHISWWQSIFTPVMVSILVCIMAILIKTFYRPDSSLDAIILVGVFFMVSPVFYFLSSLLGGFDDETIKEFKKATDLNLITRLMRWIPMIPTQLGARISPLHGKFPLKNWQAAQQEARELTLEKVNI